MDLQDIANRVKNSQPVTAQEFAYLIHNDVNALFGFMIANNPGNVQMLLRKLGYDHLGFAPDAQALKQQITILIERNDKDALNYLLKNFVVQSQGINQDVVNAINAYRSK